MNSRITKHSLLVSLVCILSFCTYSPEEDFYNKEIKEVDLSVFNISLNSHKDNDTIYVQAPPQFNYSIDHGSGRLTEVRVLLNNVLIKSSKETSGSFTLSSISTGVFQLKIEFVTSSGTGSLAEQAGVEMVQVWKSWPIKAYIETVPERPKITTSVVNGYSVVSWTPYTKTKFLNYYLQAIMAGSTRTVTITDPAVTSWVDSLYAGNTSIRYQVYTGNEVGTTASEVTISSGSNIIVDATYNAADSTISVHWPKPTYYGTFKSCTVSERDGASVQLNDPDQTTHTFKSSNSGYNYSSTIEVRIEPKSTTQFFGYGWNVVTTSVATQQFSRPIQKLTYSNGLNSVVGYFGSGDVGELFIMDRSTYSINDRIEIFNGPGYHIPYNGPFAYYSNPPTDPKRLTQVNLLTHAENSINALTSPFGSGPSLITGSESQIVSYAWFGPGSRIMYYSRIYDMANNIAIAEFSQNNVIMNYTISEDGKFARHGNQIYKIENGALSLVGALNHTGNLIGFRQDLGEEILSYTSEYVYVYDANTLAFKRTHQTPGTPPYSIFYTYDAATKCLIFHDELKNRIYAVNIDTLTTKEFKVNIPRFTFKFINGTVIIDETKYLKLY